MTSLFRLLVERSVRPPSVGGGQPSQSPDAAATRQAEAEPPRDATGAVMPRRRSRYERGPTPEPALGETVVLAEASQAADTRPGGPEAPAEARREPASAAPTARAPPHPSSASRPASSEVRDHAPRDSAPRSTSPTASPVAPPVTPSVAVVADSATSRDGDPGPRRLSAPPAREPIVDDVAAVAAAPSSSERPSRDEVAPTPPVGSTRPPIARAAEPAATAQVEPATARPGEIVPARQRDPVREASRMADVSRARAPTAALAAPSVQVSIGRVEVRAVYAPPPSAARRPSPSPTMSLDDYLKQREKG